MPARRPSEICFFCPEALYQSLVREVSKRTGRARGSIERDFSRVIELLLTRLVERPVLLAELVSRPSVRSARRRPGAKDASHPARKKAAAAPNRATRRTTGTRRTRPARADR